MEKSLGKIDKSRNKQSFLFKTLIIYFIGTFISKLASFCLLPLITNNVSTEAYGNFDLIQSIILVATPIFSLQILDALYRFLFGSEKKDKTQLVSCALFVIVVGSVFCAICFAVVNYFIYPIPCCWLAYAFYCSTILLDAMQRIARSNGENVKFAISGILNTLIMIAVQSITLVVFHMSIEGLLIGYIAGQLFSSLYLFIRLRVYKMINAKVVSKTAIKKMVHFSGPLIPNNISWWIASLTDKILVIVLISSSAQGLYAITSKFTAILLLFTDVFKLSWQETTVNFYDKVGNDTAFYSKSLSSFSKFIFMGCSFAMPCIYLIYPYFIGQSYQASLQYIPLALLGSCISSIVSFYGAGYSASKKTKGALYTSIAGMVVSIGTCAGLINFIGLYALPVSSIVSYFVVWIIRHFSMRSFFKINISWKTIIFLMCFFGFSCALFYFGGFWGNVVSAILLLFAFFLVNKDEFHSWIEMSRLALKKHPKIDNCFQRISLFFKQKSGPLLMMFLFFYPLAFLVYFVGVFVPSIRTGVINTAILLLISIPSLLPFLQKRNWKAIDICVLFYAVYSCGSILFLSMSNLPISVGFEEIAVSVLPIMFYFLAQKFFSKKNIETFFVLFLVADIFCCTAGIIWNFTIPSYYLDYLVKTIAQFNLEAWLYQQRMNSFLGSTSVGLLASAGVLISFVLFFKKRRVSFFLLVFFFVICSVLSYQRVSYVMTIFTIIVLAILFSIKDHHFRKFMIAISLIAIIIIAFMSIYKPSLFASAFERLKSIPSAFSERLDDYLAPFKFGWVLIIGKGIGSLSHHALEYGVLTITDCAYTKTLGEVGIIGFLPFLYVLGHTITSFFKSNNKEPIFVPFFSFLLVCLLSIGSNGFCFQIVAVFFWASIGFVSASSGRLVSENCVNSLVSKEIVI